VKDRKVGDATRAWQGALLGTPENAGLLAKLALHVLHQEKNPAQAALYFERLLPLREAADDHIQVARVAIAMRDWTILVERTAALKAEFSENDVAKEQIPGFERIIDAMMQITELDAREKARGGSGSGDA